MVGKLNKLNYIAFSHYNDFIKLKQFGAFNAYTPLVCLFLDISFAIILAATGNAHPSVLLVRWKRRYRVRRKQNPANLWKLKK